MDSTERGPCASRALARGRREERTYLCCQKAESVPRVNVLKVGEVQDQLGQLCCDVGLGSFEDDDGIERADEVLSDNSIVVRSE